MKRTVALLAVALLLSACGHPGQPKAIPVLTETPTPTPTVGPTVPPTPSPTPTPKPKPPPPKPKPPPKPPAPKPPPVVGIADVFVLCDSSLLSAKDELRSSLAPLDVVIDCAGSRRLPQGIAVLKARRDEIGDAAVIHLGNNYLPSEGDFGDQIDQAMKVLKGVKRVVWVTVAEKWPSRVTINAEIRAAAARWPTIRIADWAPVIAAHPGYAYDMLHLTPSGQRAIAKLIAAKVKGP